MEPQHNWSGWPGAWCLDCGAEDQREVCLAQACGVVHVWFAQEDEDGPLPRPPLCPNKPCPEPGSRRHDPYQVRA